MFFLGDLKLGLRGYVGPSPVLKSIFDRELLAGGFVAVSKANKFGEIPETFLQAQVAYITLSLAGQFCGTILIGWRRLSTPMTVTEETQRWRPRQFFWVVIESGCLYSIAYAFVLAFLVHRYYGVVAFLYAILGQIAVGGVYT